MDIGVRLLNRASRQQVMVSLNPSSLLPAPPTQTLTVTRPVLNLVLDTRDTPVISDTPTAIVVATATIRDLTPLLFIPSSRARRSCTCIRDMPVLQSCLFPSLRLDLPPHLLEVEGV